ncbi:MAG: hypothetical protein SF123_04215 [Chloroflexota bacterium]|nr:hypothetical protein [Chloroflexota bacterium]
MKPILVAIMDINDLSRHGLAALVQHHVPDTKVVGSFDSIHLLKTHLHQNPVDVLLLDDCIPQTSSVTGVIEGLLEICPKMRIIIMSYKLNVSYIQNVIQRRIGGYIYKDERLGDVLCHAFDCIRQGTLYLSPKVAALPYTHALTEMHPKVQSGELDVLHLMYAGNQVKTIAAMLGVTDRVVYERQRKLRKALGVPTTELIVAAAIKQGWLSDEER